MARILVIEDRPAIGMVFKAALGEEGHLVEVCNDGISGLERLNREPRPDVVMVDLLMPGMNGKEVVEAMRSDQRLSHIPVIIVSGCIPRPEILPPEGTFQAFVGKPFDLFEVVDTVSRLASGQACA